MSWIYREPLETAVYGRRRAFAPLGSGPTRTAPFSPARRVLSSLLAAGVFDVVQPRQRPTRFTLGLAQPGADMGRSASFTVTFTGKGDDPYGGVGMATQTSVALGPDSARELAVQNGAVFSGASASRTV